MNRALALLLTPLFRAATLIALAAAPAAVSAQDAGDVQASAQLFDRVTLLKTRDLDFGRIVVPRNGRVDMTAADTPVCTPNNQILLLDTCQSAAFEGVGGPGFQIRAAFLPAAASI